MCEYVRMWHTHRDREREKKERTQTSQISFICAQHNFLLPSHNIKEKEKEKVSSVHNEERERMNVPPSIERDKEGLCVKKEIRVCAVCEKERREKQKTRKNL